MSPSDDRNSPWARIAGSQSIAVGGEVERHPYRRDGYPEKEPPLFGFPRQRSREPSAPIRRRRRRSGETGGDRDDACSRGTRHERSVAATRGRAEDSVSFVNSECAAGERQAALRATRDASRAAAGL